jgi:hypothetical protein
MVVLRQRPTCNSSRFITVANPSNSPKLHLIHNAPRQKLSRINLKYYFFNHNASFGLPVYYPNHLQRPNFHNFTDQMNIPQQNFHTTPNPNSLSHFAFHTPSLHSSLFIFKSLIRAVLFLAPFSHLQCTQSTLLTRIRFPLFFPFSSSFNFHLTFSHFPHRVLPKHIQCIVHKKFTA